MMHCNGYIAFAAATNRMATSKGFVTQIESDETEIIVFPNPTIDGNTNLEFYNEKEQNITVRLVDSSGAAVKDIASQKFAIGNCTLAVDCSNLSPAIYFIVIEKENAKRITKKVIVK
jgi:hypothetical protein